MDPETGIRTIRRGAALQRSTGCDRIAGRNGGFHGGFLPQGRHASQPRTQVPRRQSQEEEREKEQSMKVLLTGASGFIGSQLSKRLETAGHRVLAVSRQPGTGYDWSDRSLALGVREADAVIHLAGENLFAKRW